MPAPCYSPVTTTSNTTANANSSLKRDANTRPPALTAQVAQGQLPNLKDGDTVIIQGRVVGRPELAQSGQYFVNVNVQGANYVFPVDKLRRS